VLAATDIAKIKAAFARIQTGRSNPKVPAPRRTNPRPVFIRTRARSNRDSRPMAAEQRSDSCCNATVRTTPAGLVTAGVMMAATVLSITALVRAVRRPG